MAILMGSVPPNFTFQDLVGGSMTDAPPSRSASAEQQDRNSTLEQPTRERPLRIYLPEGVVREMTLTEYREFLVSYRMTDLKSEEPE